MNRLKPSLLLIAFIACFFVVGIPYWGVPYNKVSLPSTIDRPGFARSLVCESAAPVLWGKHILEGGSDYGNVHPHGCIRARDDGYHQGPDLA